MNCWKRHATAVYSCISYSYSKSYTPKSWPVPMTEASFLAFCFIRCFTRSRCQDTRVPLDTRFPQHGCHLFRFLRRVHAADVCRALPQRFPDESFCLGAQQPVLRERDDFVRQPIRIRRKWGLNLAFPARSA